MQHRVVRFAFMSGNTSWRLFFSVVALGASIFFAVTRSPNLGLDLKGGTQIVLDLQPRPGQKLTADVANRTLEVMRKRVDLLGVSEPNLEVSGNSRIIVELPGVTDPTQAVNVIGSTAQLSIRSVVSEVTQSPAAGTTNSSVPTAPPTAVGTAPGNTSTTSAGLGATRPAATATVLGQAASGQTVPTTTGPVTPAPAGQTSTTDTSGDIVATDQDSGRSYLLGPEALNGNGVSDAQALPPDSNYLQWYVQLKFKSAGSTAWAKVTGQAACNITPGDVKREVAIVLDNQIITHPEVAPDTQCDVGIKSDKPTLITSPTFSESQTKSLALLVRGGALPVNVKVASRETVGPELGKSAIHASEKAVIVGGILTLAYILVYYRFLGLVAGVALGAYGLISYAILLGLKLTLTLPGIAGFVLAIAMAMDSNVLVYERVKEEYANGRSLRSSAQMGFKNALSAIIDSNATTFIAAGTLFFLAVGEVKGFGVTLLVGTASSILVTLILLRTMITGLLSGNTLRQRPRLLGLHVGAKFRKRMSDNPPNLLRASKYALVVSTLVIVLGVAGIAIRGINYGIEFTGGNLLEYQTPHAVNLDKARAAIGKFGFTRSVVQQSNNVDTSVRVPAITADQKTKIDGVMKELGGGKATRLRDETIGPSFGKELKRKALIGLVIGVGLQLAWVAYRFRWTFGIGAVVAMIHDAILVLGLFAWLHKAFDAVFLAALLTIIAYSVNDTVVVFDRIREQRRRRGGESFATVVSDACAQTFPRTVNIGLSAVFILASLLFLGGETLSDFALALLVGVVTGVYSSVFVASPIAVLLERWKPAMSGRLATSSSSARRNTSSGNERPRNTNSGNRPANRPTTKPNADATDSDDDSESDSGDDSDGEQTPTRAARPKPANRPAPRPRKKTKKRR